MLPVRPLPVILAGNEGVTARQERLRARDIGRIDALEAELTDLLDIAPQRHGTRAGGANVIGGDVVAELKKYRYLDSVRERIDRRKICDIGPANDGDTSRFFLGQGRRDEVTGRCAALGHDDIRIDQCQVARISDFSSKRRGGCRLGTAEEDAVLLGARSAGEITRYRA